MHCSLPLRQLSELSYLLQCFNLFICHLENLPICQFAKLLRKTSANYFGKLRKTTSEKYSRKLLRPKSCDENSSDRKLWGSGECSFIVCPSPPSPPFQIKLGGPITLNCSGIKKQNNYLNPLLSAFCKFQCESVKLLPISYVRCSKFELFTFFVYIQPRVIFIRKVAISKPLNDLSLHVVHSPAYGCPLSLER